MLVNPGYRCDRPDTQSVAEYIKAKELMSLFFSKEIVGFEIRGISNF